MEIDIDGKTVIMHRHKDCTYKGVWINQYSNKLTNEKLIGIITNDDHIKACIEFIDTHPNDMFDLVMANTFQYFSLVVDRLLFYNDSLNFNDNFYVDESDKNLVIKGQDKTLTVTRGHSLFWELSFKLGNKSLTYTVCKHKYGCQCDIALRDELLGDHLIGKPVKSALY